MTLWVQGVCWKWHAFAEGVLVPRVNAGLTATIDHLTQPDVAVCFPVAMAKHVTRSHQYLCDASQCTTHHCVCRIAHLCYALHLQS
jgi:hypothetical protein